MFNIFFKYTAFPLTFKLLTHLEFVLLSGAKNLTIFSEGYLVAPTPFAEWLSFSS